MAGIIKVNQYQDFNGNTLFTSDGNGNLTTMKTNYPMFRAFLSANQSISNNSATKVQLDGSDIDTNNAFDTSTNYRFTVPSGYAGKYAVFIVGQFDNLGSAKVSQFRIHLNGSNYNSMLWPKYSDNNNEAFTEGSILDLSAGDYLEYYVYQNSGSSKNLRGGSTALAAESYMFGYRIGS